MTGRLLLPALLLGMHLDPGSFIARWGYPAVFAIVFLETAGIPLPGEATLLLAGVAAGTGHLDLVFLVPVGIVAAIAGDNVGYAIGRYGGRRLVLRMAHLGRVEGMLDWGERFFARHGGKTVFLARWTAGLRIFGAWIAGLTHMRYRVFFFWNAAGGISWATTVILLGYAFSGSVATIEGYLGTGGAIAGGAAIAVAFIFLLHRIHRRQRVARERAEAAATGAGSDPD